MFSYAKMKTPNGSRTGSKALGKPSPVGAPFSRQTTENFFPHRAAIENATGVPIPGRASFDATYDQQITPAFTNDLHSTFAQRDPSLRIAAHEAAHQFQHAGLTRDAGLGPEGHAQRLAALVEQGASAREMITQSGRRVEPGIRPYVQHSDLPDPATDSRTVGWSVLNTPVRIAWDQDNGMLPVVATGNDQQFFFADKLLVQKANAKLQQKQSGVELAVTNDYIQGGPLHNIQLHRVAPLFKNNPQSPGFPIDCGEAAREVIGPHGQNDLNPAARFTDKYGDVEYAKTQPEHNWVRNGTLDKLKIDRKRYEYSDDKLSEARDKKHKINRHADPSVGDAYTMLYGKGDIGYHWAGVIMVAGGDRVTLESFGTKTDAPGCRGDNWFIHMYGGPTGSHRYAQTFFDEWAGDRSNGDLVVAMEMRDYTQYTTAELIAAYNKLSDDSHAAAVVGHELMQRSIVFSIEVKETEDLFGKDRLILEVKGPGALGKMYTSPETLAATGDTVQFTVAFEEFFDIRQTVSASKASYHYQNLHKGDPIEITIYEVDPTSKNWHFYAKWEHGKDVTDGFEDSSWSSNKYYRLTTAVEQRR